MHAFKRSPARYRASGGTQFGTEAWRVHVALHALVAELEAAAALPLDDPGALAARVAGFSPLQLETAVEVVRRLRTGDPGP